jgi:hypothetical protein
MYYIKAAQNGYINRVQAGIGETIKEGTYSDRYAIRYDIAVETFVNPLTFL